MSFFKASVVGAVFVVAGASTASAQSTGTAEFLASIRSAGTIINGSGVSSAAKISIGRYRVDFPRDVVNCAYVATPLSGSQHKAVARVTSSALNRVLVTTFVNSGVLQDVGFNLIVKCQD